MKCSEIITLLEKLSPAHMACSWDNPGLMAGRTEKEVKKILITLDTDDRAVEHASAIGADMIVSHHPLIFKPIRRVTDEDFIGNRLVRMLREDICCYAMHTNFDAAPGCMADTAAGMIGICGGEPIEEMGQEDGLSYGIGKVGTLAEPMTVRKLAERIKESFGLPYVLIYGEELFGEQKVTRAAVCPGSGGSVIDEAIKKNAQVLITGDIGHHEGIDANARGLVILDAGHYGLEHIFLTFIEEYLRENLGDQAELIRMPVTFPASAV